MTIPFFGANDRNNVNRYNWLLESTGLLDGPSRSCSAARRCCLIAPSNGPLCYGLILVRTAGDCSDLHSFRSVYASVALAM